MNANLIRDACQQFGTLLNFKAAPGMACVQYENVAIAKDAAIQMNNSQVTADVSTGPECLSVIDANLHSMQQSVGHPPPQGPFSSMGGLWGTPGQSSQPPPGAFGQPPNFPPSQPPSNMGGFSPWGMPPPHPPPQSNNQSMMESSQLWGPGPPPGHQQQPSAGSMFTGFNGGGGWLPSKPVDAVSNSVFNPSELLNYTREQGS